MKTDKEILDNLKNHRINGANVGLTKDLEVYHTGVVENIILNIRKADREAVVGIVRELASNSPLDSNDIRRGYQQMATDIINELNK